MSNSNILVTGATGRQGGAVIKALSALLAAAKEENSNTNNTNIKIYALTRDVNSSGTKKLASRYPHIKLISGSFEDPEAVFAACNAASAPITSVFAVQLPVGFPPNAEAEERHGKSLIDAAIAHGVRCYVQTSVDRGPDSATNATKVPHFISKYNIEKHLEKRVRESQGRLSYTVLRPTVFMEGFSSDSGFLTKLFATSMRDRLPADLKIQLVATDDIGWFAAQALVHPEDGRYNNQSISLAGDSLTYAQMCQVYQEVTGRELETTFTAVTWALGLLVKELPMTLDCWVNNGFSADIDSLKRLRPGGLITFRLWLEQSMSKQ